MLKEKESHGQILVSGVSVSRKKVTLGLALVMYG